jgi:hypothetical protein
MRTARSVIPVSALGWEIEEEEGRSSSRKVKRSEREDPFLAAGLTRRVVRIRRSVPPKPIDTLDDPFDGLIVVEDEASNDPGWLDRGVEPEPFPSASPASRPTRPVPRIAMRKAS